MDTAMFTARHFIHANIPLLSFQHLYHGSDVLRSCIGGDVMSGGGNVAASKPYMSDMPPHLAPHFRRRRAGAFAAC